MAQSRRPCVLCVCSSPPPAPASLRPLWLAAAHSRLPPICTWEVQTLFRFHEADEKGVTSDTSSDLTSWRWTPIELGTLVTRQPQSITSLPRDTGEDTMFSCCLPVS
ncbi:hypothetical protein QTO34_005548 [Cnephaeus nilssonii]|uniref:Uncharacterized protein n=1 Tax=Cnephaeus nilssonii TaxID=3371016 RepID=A0AA40HPH5_CNENI|nr:hypothetical protein QTO34_005548 [Eptesicus nilssonii]